MKHRLLDLFSGAGGAGMGYHRAGFEVVGVDINPQPHYPFEFHQADALEYLAEHGHEFDAIHASPPCQGYSRVKNLIGEGKYPKLIEPVRAALIASGKPYVIENVIGAPLLNPLMLCGEAFGLGTYRHRLFETSFPVPFMMHSTHNRSVDKSSGKNRRREMVQVWGHAQYAGYLERAKTAMGIDWDIREEELAEAIPPAYTEYIGGWLRKSPEVS
jgi:DNA (cytosine-5)-methyltransferase 1